MTLHELLTKAGEVGHIAVEDVEALLAKLGHFAHDELHVIAEKLHLTHGEQPVAAVETPAEEPAPESVASAPEAEQPA